MCVSRYLEYFGLPLASFTLNSYGLTLLQPRQQWWVPYCPGVSWSLLYLWFHSEAPCWDCLGPHCGNSAAFSGCWMCCEEPRGRMSAQPLEFPQCSDRELSESGTFKERCHIICITPNAKAGLLQAQGICTGPKSDAQTTICFELGDRDGRVPVSGLLLSVCAVRAPPPPVSGSSHGGLCLLPARLCLRKPYSLLPLRQQRMALVFASVFSFLCPVSPPSVLPDRHSEVDSFCNWLPLSWRYLWIKIMYFWKWILRQMLYAFFDMMN